MVELVRQLVERQPLRRVERAERFGLPPSDLNLDLGPLGTLLPE